MDQTKKNPDPEDFAKNVESTIDELFCVSRQIEIDPLTNEVKELSQDKTDKGHGLQILDQVEKHSETIKFSDTTETEEPAEQIENSIKEKILESGSDLELEEKDTKEANLEQQFSQLNQLLLTLEWEVNQKQALSAKNLVETIQKNPKIEADKKLQELLNLMTKLLEGIVDHPEKMPTFSPDVLKRGLDTLKILVWNKGHDPSAENEAFRSVKKELESAIDMDVSEIDQQVCGKAVSGHLIEEGDTLDSVTEHDVQNNAQKEKSSYQKGYISSSISEVNILEKAAAIETASSENSVLGCAVKSHIKILDDCIKYIQPVEKLLAQTQGMEKLHHFQRNIKNRLEEQKKILGKALAGYYEPSSDMSNYATQRIEDITVEIDNAETPPVSTSCPWNELLTGQWDQKQVAFIPEHVAFTGPLPFWTKKGLKNSKTFKLKKLRAWPWTKIQPLMHGKLSNQKESELIKLEFPVLQKSISSSENSQSSDLTELVVLFKDNKGLVLLMDTQLKTISITPEYSWKPSIKNDGQWVGNLSIDNKEIYVATMESLLNTLPNE
ncbi:MAG: hypothetical protein AVO38_02850 [delta proteobacterium ML8_D]|jgi:hypothetical protein|nr:MAG: hypothetical protein AVO38_02850 [delta proteobacterium ML8_D]